MKGRRPKPTALKALQGGAGHRRDDGLREVEMPSGTPEPPAHLSPGAKQEFFRVVKYLGQVHGLLTPTDHAAIGIYCSYYDQWQQAEKDIPRLRDELESARKRDKGMAYARLNNAIGERNRARKEMRSYLTELGLTPAARARIRVPDGQGEFAFGGPREKPQTELEKARAQLTGA